MSGRRAYAVVFALALGWAALLAALIEQPGYTDAYYYYNAAQRWVGGDGLTDPYLWTYLDAPTHLPAPAFRYWMPLTSLLAAGSMALFGVGFGAAQVPSALSFAALVTLTYALGVYAGGGRRYGVLGALLVAFGGFYTPFWTTSDAFALYGLLGAGALVAVGRGRGVVVGVLPPRPQQGASPPVPREKARRAFSQGDGEAGVREAAEAREGNDAPLALRRGTRRRAGSRGRRPLVGARGRSPRNSAAWRWYALGGALSGLAHLTRADGVLLLLVLLAVALWPKPRAHWRGAVAGVLAYLLVMSPWLARNWAQFGAPLSSGGLSTAWLRSYDDLVAYPPQSSAADFWAWGAGNILASRWEALRNNAGTFLAVETWVVLGPFALGALWARRKSPFWWGVALYALTLHVAMTLVFAFPGYRGGLFHSAAALLPFWAVLSALGLDDGIAWLARRRRWPRAQAQNVFGGAAVVLAGALSLGALSARVPKLNANGRFYCALAADLPLDAVVMVNDPPALYYHTGLAGVVVPNADPAVVPQIARRYGVTHLLLDVNRTEPFTRLWLGQEQRDFLRLLRVYGAETPDPSDDRRLFEIVLQGQCEP